MGFVGVKDKNTGEIITVHTSQIMPPDNKITCRNCNNLWYEGGHSIDMPYPEISCMKNHWDGIESYDDLDMPTDCKDFELEE